MAEQFEFVLKWRSKLTKYVITHPLLKSRNLAFVCTKPVDNAASNSSIFAFAAGTGGLVWEHAFENSSISGISLYESTRTKKQQAILSLTSNDFLHGSGEVIAINPAGEIVWRIKLKDKTISAPVIIGGRLFITDGGDSLTGINLESQEILFEHSLQGSKSSLSAVAIKDHTAFIPCRSGELLALNIEDGSQQWKFSLDTIDPKSGREWLDKTPIVDGSKLYAATTKGKLICLNVENGQLIWHKQIEENAPLSQPMIGSEAVFLGGKTGIFALNKNNGKQIWKHETARRVSAQPQTNGNLLFATGEDHFVYVLHTKTGEVISSFEMERRIEIPVLLSPDSIYAVDRASELKVFKFSPAQANLASKTTPATNTAEEADRLAKAGKWLEAAKIFENLDDYPARANALAEYARFVSTTDASDHDKTIAWEKAADAYTESGESDKKQLAKVEAARHAKQPLFEINIQESIFTLESWSKINYTLKNVGFGLARFVGVFVNPETVLFEWQKDNSNTSFSLPSDRNLSGSVTVRPLHIGNSVPLELIIEYLDVHDRKTTIRNSFYVSVMRNQDETNRMMRVREFDGQGIAETPIQLRNVMVEAFDRDEFDDIVYELDFNIDDFPGPLNTAARDFIDAVLRKGVVDKLITIMVRERDYLAPK